MSEEPVLSHIEMRTCSKCGRNQPITEFWKVTWRDGTRHPGRICKTCARTYKREEYRRKRKKPDGIRLDPSDGRIYEHNGLSRRIYWSPQMLDDLRRLYPRTKNEDISDRLMVSQRTMTRKARELGLKKDEEWLRRMNQERLTMMKYINKIQRNDGMFKPGEHANPDGEFKKKRTKQQIEEEHEIQCKESEEG